MSNKHIPLRGSSALLENPRRFARTLLGLILLILGGFLLYAFSPDAPARAADADLDQFVQKLQLPRNPESTLNEILSRSEFQDSEKESLADKLRTLLHDAVRRILAWIADRLPKVKLPEAELDFFWMLMGSFAVAAVAVLIVLLLLYATKSLGRKKLYPDEDEEFDVPGLASSASMRATAIKSAEQGNYRDALIGMFRYVLLWLDERGRLSLHQVKTNREVLESLRTDAPLRNTLGEMIPIFNRVRYGDFPCDKHEYEKFLTLCGRVDIEQVVDRRPVKEREFA